MSSGPQTPNEWSQHTRDIWFYGALAASTAALIYLFSPYLFVLLFAAVTVVVTWPLYEWVLSRTKRPAVSAVATTLLLAVVVFGPVVFVIYLFTLEAVEVAELRPRWCSPLQARAPTRMLAASRLVCS